MPGAEAPQAAAGARTGPQGRVEANAPVRASQAANATAHGVHTEASLASVSSGKGVKKKVKRQRVKLCWGSDIRVVELVSPPELEEVASRSLKL